MPLESFPSTWTLSWALAFPTLLPLATYSEEDNQEVPIHYSFVAFRRLFPPNQEHAPTHQTITDDNPSLTYGEITPETVIEVLSFLKCKTSLREGGKVIDLGSGNGLVLFAACFVHSFDEAVGIEILPHLHEEALQNLAIWKKEMDFHTCADSTKFTFLCEDMRAKRDLITDANLVICHATLFDEGLMQYLRCVFPVCAPGTIFIMVSRPIENVAGVETISVQQKSMSWGNATVYVQRKT